MPRGIPKTAKTSSPVGPSEWPFFTVFHIRKFGDSWRAMTPDNTVIAIDADREALTARVQLSAKIMTEQNGNVEVLVYNERGLREVTYSYWCPHTLENFDKPINSVQDQVSPF